jgi:hypothetical protein
MARLGCSFSFLRRSFLADTNDRDVAIEIPRILEAIGAARRRSDDEIIRARRELVDAISAWRSSNAVP